MQGKEEGIIWLARSKGFSAYFPAVPSFDEQRRRTAEAAREWLNLAPVNCASCKEGIAHDHSQPTLDECGTCAHLREVTAGLLKVLQQGMKLLRHDPYFAQFDNGVVEHGISEAEQWAGQWYADAEAAILEATGETK